jgi:hypothetical protein
VDISFPREEIYVSDFTDRGDGVYFRFTPDERGDSHLSIRWLSGPHAVEIDFYGSGVESIVLDAYLEKYPLVKEGVLCTDSDGGIDYYAAGWVQDYVDTKPFHDYCTGNGGDGTKCIPSEGDSGCGIIEKYCANNRRNGRFLAGDDFMQTCPYGCADGACLFATPSQELRFRVGTDSNKYEMTENNDGNPNGENIGSVISVIGEDQLETLADGEVTTEKGTVEYQQSIAFQNILQSDTKGSGFVQFLENDDDSAKDFFYIRSAEQIARYSIEFKNAFQSDIRDAAGAPSTSGLILGDYEGARITIVGEEYSIVKARKTISTGNSVELTLMGGASRDSLKEGATQTYTVDGRDYEVTVTTITDAGTIYAKFSVNGESTRSLGIGEITTLSDGTQIGVTDLIANDVEDVTQDTVEFYLGVEKIFLKDTDITNTLSSNSLEVGNEDIDDVDVIITGTISDNLYSLDTIQLDITADDDYYVDAGHKLSEYMDEPQALIGWDILYDGLEDVDDEHTRIKTSGSDQYNLEFVDGDANLVDIPLAFSSATTNLKLGDSNDDLILKGSKTISKNDYFIVSDTSEEDGRRKTYAFRYNGADKVQSGDSAAVKLDNLGTGQRIELTFTPTTADTPGAELIVGGVTFGIIGASDNAITDFDIKVDLDADGIIASDDDEITINTNAGLKITVDDQTANSSKIHITYATPNPNDFDNIVPTDVPFTIIAENAEVELREAAQSTINFISPSADSNNRIAYSSRGARFELDNDPNELLIEYPEEQRLPQLFIISQKP